jgi:spore coat polysaccharide biosynthesis protein SpsF
MKTGAIVMARMGSSRLPGKVLLPFHGGTVLEMLLKRLKDSRVINEVIVATSTNPFDDVICSEVKKYGFPYFRGDENHVIYRAIGAAETFDIDVIVDITADCPFVDPRHIDNLHSTMVTQNFDYISNDVFARSWPDGFDIQIYKTEALKKAAECITDERHYSHCGWNIGHYRDHIPEIKMCNVPAPEDYKWPELGLTLDTLEDYVMMYRLWETMLLEDTWLFTAERLIRYLKENPSEITNQEIKRKIPGSG